VNHDNDYPLVTFLIKENQYAISAKYVCNMVAVPPTRPVPHAPSYVRGIINLRGKVLPLIDLRSRLGFGSKITELTDFTTMLAKREQDHKNWLNELEASIVEKREFTLTTDPHKCAFGKWYDNYETNDLSARAILRKFDRPHRRIHAIAHQVEELQAAGDHKAAANVVAEAKKKELQVMIKLFASIGQHMKEAAREIAMIVETPTFDYAVAIDMVKVVEFLAPGTLEKLPAGLDSGITNNLVTLIGRRQTDNSSVQILDASRICDPDDVKGLKLVSQEEQLKEPQPV